MPRSKHSKAYSTKAWRDAKKAPARSVYRRIWNLSKWLRAKWWKHGT